MRWHDMDGESWVWMASMMVLFWGLAVAGVVLLVRIARHDGERRSTAADVLDERFARGEISVEESEQRRAVLRRTDTAGRR